jgi:quercetin dioxygenase-like cupin family protein
MRSADPTDHPTAATTWSEADLVELTIRLANQPTAGPRSQPATGPRNQPATEPANVPVNEPANGPANGPSTEPTPAAAGPLAGRAAEQQRRVLWSSTTPTGAAWSVPLLVTPYVEAWLLGWPAGLVTPAHGHGGATVAVTVVEGSLSEECLDPTIWTTGRRTTWRAGASTVFPSGHVHLLGAAGGRPAVAVHAWSGPAGSADRVAGRFALAGAAAVAGPGPGGGRVAAEPVGVGPGRGGDGRRAGHPVHGAADLVHVRDRVAG